MKFIVFIVLALLAVVAQSQYSYGVNPYGMGYPPLAYSNQGPIPLPYNQPMLANGNENGNSNTNNNVNSNSLIPASAAGPRCYC